MQLFSRQSLTNVAKQEIVAPTPCIVTKLWLADSDCPLPPLDDATMTEDINVPTPDESGFIAKKQLVNNATNDILTTTA
jgi:hypothetical protein